MHSRPVVVMFSDGLATSWSPESHPGLFALDPTLIAGGTGLDTMRAAGTTRPWLCGRAETMEWPLLTVALRNPEDIAVARHRAPQIASLAGLDASSQTRLAASVSEISRNAIAYAGGGRVAFAIARTPFLSLTVAYPTAGLHPGPRSGDGRAHRRQGHPERPPPRG